MLTRKRTAIITVVVGAIVNLALAIIKLYIGLATNSISILSDATNNFIDILSSIVAAVAFFLAAKAVSKKYPYGYGRSEYLAGFVISVIVVIVGISFVYASATRFMMPVPIWFSWVYFGIISGTVLVKLAMGLFYKFINKKIESDAIKALMLDSYIDTAITIMVLTGFLLAEYSGLRIDAIFGIVTGIMIIISGIKLVIKNTGALIGEGATEIQQETVGKICKKNNAECKSFQLHDYGVNKKQGILELNYNDKSDEEIKRIDTQIKEEINKELGIDIIVYR